MGLKVRKLPIFVAILIMASLIALFIIAVSGNGYTVNTSPFISTDMHPGRGENITVSGQNFTPNGTAILYITDTMGFTANVDKDGNTSWTYTNPMIAPYPVYAVDTTTNVTSNTLSVQAFLNDYPPTPTPILSPTPIEGICAIGFGVIISMYSRKNN